ncbi:LuxR C-terminal-related transcriptional regulator [Streptosporangium sp. CA-135522]|uniref:helix-turn-helix transcriptional regulator n=1 Tax=Streptosporangium sp. CA-135522 TaxID=3240072 RepID=UPI003D89FC43
MENLRRPWPFVGRSEELDLVRQSLSAGHRGIVVTGSSGSGKTRLAAEAIRGMEHVMITGTPGTRPMPLAAFAHLLPDTVSLHRAAQALRAVRVLVVDDAHLLDDASAALVHHLVVHGRTRLLVMTRPDGGAPDAVSRLLVGDLLPSLVLDPLPPEATARLLEVVLSGRVDALTARRLHRACQGDLWLLREVVIALHSTGRLSGGTGPWIWRGPMPITSRVGELAAAAIGDVGAGEREAMELLAFGEPMEAAALPGAVLESLEAKRLVTVDDRSAVRLAHPLHGPVLRARAGRLRAGRLRRAGRDCAAALATECEDLLERVNAGDLREISGGVGEWLVEEDAGWDEPAMPEFCARRARFARLRGEIREALSWSREGLRRCDDHPACLAELAHAAVYLGDLQTARHALSGGGPVPARTWLLAAEGDIDGALRYLTGSCVFALHDAVRLGAPGLVADRLGQRPGGIASLLADHAIALISRDGAALDRVAGRLEQRGLLLHAAEASAQAAVTHRDHRAARVSRNRASALARRCQGARTPALVDVTLGELTPRQRQIVSLAAGGLSNRQIAEQLTLSIRTVANHLYGAYSRLGSGDRAGLRSLF